MYGILGLQPRDQAAMLVVNTKEIFWQNLHQIRVHFPAERIAFVFDPQHGRRDVTCKPAIVVSASNLGVWAKCRLDTMMVSVRYWREFCVSKYGLSLTVTPNSNSPCAYIFGGGGGLNVGMIFASEIWGAYFWEGLLSKFYSYSALEFFQEFSSFNFHPCHPQQQLGWSRTVVRVSVQ